MQSFRPELAALGSGADFVAFQDHLGLPTLSVEFDFPGSYGTYHSNHDTRRYFERFADPGFRRGETLARVLGLTVMRLAEAPRASAGTGTWCTAGTCTRSMTASRCPAWPRPSGCAIPLASAASGNGWDRRWRGCVARSRPRQRSPEIPLRQARRMPVTMNPDVAAAVDRLSADGVLTPRQAVVGREARGLLLSVRAELRLLHYGGVLAVMAGVGVLVQENLDRIGPVVIASCLSSAAAAALVWALRHAPPFSWGESFSTHLAFDYILLLGVLLTGAALAYVEVQFTPLGAAWRHHLLLVAAVAAALAVRGDSRVVATLALTTFAAWRGVSASPLERAFWTGDGAVRANAMATGLLFVILGRVLVWTSRKAHFEPVGTYLGWLLILGAILSGIDAPDAKTAFRAGLFVVGGGLAVLAYRAGRFPLFGMGLVAAYVGLSALVVSGAHDAALAYLWFAGTGIAVLAGLLVAHNTMRRRP